MTDYPAEPWDLRGQLHSSAFLVPLVDVPVDLPPGCTPLRVAGRGIVGVAWVDYEPPGVLSYREIMAVLMVRRGWRVLPTIVAIWVDSPASRDGGRALWGIPKDLASFDFSADGFQAWDERGGIATGSVRPRVNLPGRLPVSFSVVQWRNGAAKVSSVRSKAKVALSSATFAPDPDGPLGFLSGHRPLVSFSMRDFVMSFGRAADQH
ncbi:MAG: acetoacetate decarboxylase family protein [Jatrophihabitans sp.]